MFVLVQFRRVLVGSGVVQLLDGMLMVVDGLLSLGMNVRMRVLVCMRVLVFVGVDSPVGVSVLVAVVVRVNVLMSVFVFDFCGGHCPALLSTETDFPRPCNTRQFYAAVHPGQTDVIKQPCVILPCENASGVKSPSSPGLVGPSAHI